MYFHDDHEDVTDPLQRVLARFPGRWTDDAVELARVHETVSGDDEDWVTWLDEASGRAGEPEPDLWIR